jgi:uncharacterized membrane protein YcaP (DUF421 family)
LHRRFSLPHHGSPTAGSKVVRLVHQTHRRGILDSLLELFAINVPVWEIVVRGSVTFLLIFAFYRFVMRRDIGAVGVADVLVLVLIADAAQNAMAGEYTTISEGAILVGTLIGWNVLFDRLAYRYEGFAKFAEPEPLPLVQRGRILARNLRRESLTVKDLMAKLREHGIDDLSVVKNARMESDGEITVIRNDGGSAKPAGSARKRVT